MHDEVAPAVGADMDGVPLDGDAAEARAAIVAHGFVVIAGDEDEVAPLRTRRSSFCSTSLWACGQ